MHKPSEGKGAQLVDAHAHIFTRALPLTPDARYIPFKDFSADDYLNVLDQHGIPFGVIAAASFLGTYNDYTVRALRRTPRLRATAIVDPAIDPYVLREMNEDGIVGIRFGWRGLSVPDISSSEYKRLLHRVADLGWHVHVHVEGPKLPSILPTLVSSNVNLVIDHFARPDPEKGLNCPGFQASLKIINNGRTWMKISAPYRLDGVNANLLVRKLLEEAGPQRLLWGSDWPWVDFEDAHTYQHTLEWLREMVPNPRDRDVISDNALKLYRFT